MLMVIFSNKILAQGFQTEYGVPIQTKYGVPQPLYGMEPIMTPVITPSVTPSLDQPLYGVISTASPAVTPTPIDFHDIPQILYGPPQPPDNIILFEKILVYLIVPFVILVVFIIGIMVYLKRKKKNENTKKDI